VNPFRVATWNVNSIKVRLPHLIQWLDAESQKGQPIDVIGLQELKLTEDKFPFQEIEKAGYYSFVAGQKTYNGVAILVRKESLSRVTQSPETAFLDGQKNIPGFTDEQQRLVAATIHIENTEPIRFVCGYFPNGQAPNSEKFVYKLRWLEALSNFIKEQLKSHHRLFLVGDYNIAPKDEDVHDPAAWVGQNLVSPEERSAFFALEELGLVDTYRMFEQAPKSFSWWDYRMMGFRRNAGLRIDHILISKALQEKTILCSIDKTPRTWEQPSDHAPVVATINR
jgi:exodeoxyribonuclease-3